MRRDDDEFATDREVMAGATPGPWTLNHVDDGMAMNAFVVATEAGTGELDDYENNVAIVLLQEPRYANLRDAKWRENAAYIVRARTRWPWLLDRCMKMQERIASLVEENSHLRRRLESRSRE